MIKEAYEAGHVAALEKVALSYNLLSRAADKALGSGRTHKYLASELMGKKRGIPGIINRFKNRKGITNNLDMADKRLNQSRKFSDAGQVKLISKIEKARDSLKENFSKILL